MPTIRYRSTRACELLQPRVARYWQLESEEAIPDAHGRWSLPDGGSEWFFVFADPLVRASQLHRAGAYAAGVTPSAFLSKPAGRMLLFGIAFRPGGAAAVTGLPANELTGRTVPLEVLWGRRAESIAERMAEAPSFGERVHVIQQELLERFGRTDAEVDGAVRRLTANPSMSIASLAGDDSSARRLERKFLAHVGIGPKRLARMLRLQRATRLWAAGRVDGGAALAAAAGYADQAHMVREYRALAGTTPVGHAERELSESFNTEDR